MRALLAALLLAGSAQAQAPQGRFDAYPADTAPPASTRPPDLDAAPASGRGAFRRAALRGPFFAGHIAVARWTCGATCEAWAVVDIVSGRIVVDDGLQQLRGGLPCAAEALEFREDSRLLRVHRVDGGRVLTQDFLWSDGRLEKSAESAQSAAEFCAVRMR